MSTNYWQGSLVRLRAVEPADGEAHFLWNHDTDTNRGLDRVRFPQSCEAARRWAERAATREPSGDAFHFEIENLSGELVGAIATHNCDPRNGTFAYGLSVWREYRRRGYASQAVALVLRYYFQELRYQKVTVHVYAFNEPSIHLHERLGFEREGRLRRMEYTDGQFHDVLIFGLTAEEFVRQGYSSPN